MKNKLFTLCIIALASCGTPKEYRIALVYVDGTPDTLNLYGEGTNLFGLRNGDLRVTGYGIERNIRSGVRSFKVLSFGEAKLKGLKYVLENIK